MENLPPHRRNAIHEILRGRDFTCQLKQLLHGGGDGGSAEDLVAKILTSFSQTLSILNNNVAETSTSADEVSQCLDAPKSEISSGDDSVSKGSYAKDERRGYCKKTLPSNSWVNETPTLVDDGHGWRKYGQKTIHKSDFPRHYYRCTHKHDQKCQATKQVQMIQSDPTPIYRTTYSGRHTCTNHISHDNYFSVDPTDSAANNVHLISFNNSSTPAATSSPFLTAFSSPAVLKQEPAVSVGGDVDVKAASHVGQTSHNQSDVEDDEESYQGESSFFRMLLDPPTVDYGWFADLKPYC
ncbi:WRKY DNA-binding transcription factor 70 [Linum perenne]